MAVVSAKLFDIDSKEGSEIEVLAKKLLAQKQENLFQEFLNETRHLIDKHTIKSRTCFISYAWEDESIPEGGKKNQQLQNWLERLSIDLKKIGIKVYLDIKGIQGEMEEWMKKGIAESDHILLIGTPRYKTRASQPTNVAFELKLIREKVETAKVKGDSNVLLPLLYTGDFSNSFPEGITRHLIRDFRESQNYYPLMGGYKKPLGLIPDIYPELDERGEYHSEYLALFQRFDYQFRLIEAQQELEKIKTQQLKSVVKVTKSDNLDVSSTSVSSQSTIPSLSSSIEEDEGSQYNTKTKKGIPVFGQSPSVPATDEDEGPQYKTKPKLATVNTSQTSGTLIFSSKIAIQRALKLGDNHFKEKDYKKAVEYYSQAAEQGSSEAQCKLGDYYYQSDDTAAYRVEPDYEQAIKWYTQATTQGSPAAYRMLGDCYYRGFGVQQDYKRAMEYYKLSADLGDLAALNNMGNAYEKGRLGRVELEKAATCYVKAAEAGYSESQFNLARCYRFGKGVTQDLGKARHWYTQAAEQGNSGAKEALEKLTVLQIV